MPSRRRHHRVLLRRFRVPSIASRLGDMIVRPRNGFELSQLAIEEVAPAAIVGYG